jgi:hypothetical protein
MSSGRERAVLVWEGRHALATQRLEEIERTLTELRGMEEPPSRKRRERMAELEEERRQAMLDLARLGPSPRAKMG